MATSSSHGGRRTSLGFFSMLWNTLHWGQILELIWASVKLAAGLCLISKPLIGATGCIIRYM